MCESQNNKITKKLKLNIKKNSDPQYN